MNKKRPWQVSNYSLSTIWPWTRFLRSLNGWLHHCKLSKERKMCLFCSSATIQWREREKKWIVELRMTLLVSLSNPNCHLLQYMLYGWARHGHGMVLWKQWHICSLYSMGRRAALCQPLPKWRFFDPIGRPNFRQQPPSRSSSFCVTWPTKWPKQWLRWTVTVDEKKSFEIARAYAVFSYRSAWSLLLAYFE